MPKVLYTDLGRMDYKEAWDYQTILFQKSVAYKLENKNNPNAKPPKNYFLYVEHPHVYTLGKSGALQNLLLDEKALAEKEATFYKINRGGDITYHGPGQIVGYPILDLGQFKPDFTFILKKYGRGRYSFMRRLRHQSFTL